VALSWADFIVIAVLVGVGCVLSYIGLWLVFRERQQAVESQLGTLTAVLKAMEARVPELSQPAATAPVVEEARTTAAVKPVVDRKDEEVTPETLVIIAAAVTAYLGKKVRVRSAKLLLPPVLVVNPWVQRGRTLVHSSHNLCLRH
jgi:methylmalonyl-CoA carboxyltransferase 12S subunit